MLIHQLLESGLKTCDHVRTDDISDIVLLTKQFCPTPETRAACRPYEYMPNCDDTPHVYPAGISCISSIEFGVYGTWIPNPDTSDNNVTGIVVSYSTSFGLQSIYNYDLAKDLQVHVTYVMPDGSLIAYNTVYMWRDLAELTLNEFFAKLVPELVRRHLWGVLGTAWDYIEDKRQPVMSNGTGIIALYPFEVYKSNLDGFDIDKLTQERTHVKATS